jgi:predicted small lipoprotein YifL
MKRLLRNFLLVLLAVGLVACGPPKKSVFPPTVTVQQLQVLPSGHWQLTVRIQNNSYGEMDFNSLEGQLQISALMPIRLHGTFELDVPALVGDVIQLDGQPTTAMTQALQAIAGKGSAGSLAYRVSGSTNAKPEQEKQTRDFNFSGNDWLSPVPGIANTYR